MDTIDEKTSEIQAQPIEKSQKKGGFPIKTLFLIVTLAFITIGLIVLAVMPKQPKNEPTPQVQITPNPIQTILTISSIPVAQSTPSAYITDVIINTGQSSVTSVQLELSYDPQVLKDVDIKTGSFFINPQVELKNIDEANGRISFALSTNDSLGALGQGILAKISFKTIKKNTPTSIDFLPKTQVKAIGISESVLKSTVGATFNFSPTPTLIASPTATPSGK